MVAQLAANATASAGNISRRLFVFIFPIIYKDCLDIADV